MEGKIIILLDRIYITSGTKETGRGFRIERTKLPFVPLAAALAVPSTVLNRKRYGRNIWESALRVNGIWSNRVYRNLFWYLSREKKYIIQAIPTKRDLGTL